MVCGRCAVGFWLGGVKEVREVGGGGGRRRRRRWRRVVGRGGGWWVVGGEGGGWWRWEVELYSGFEIGRGRGPW